MCLYVFFFQRQVYERAKRGECSLPFSFNRCSKAIMKGSSLSYFGHGPVGRSIEGATPPNPLEINLFPPQRVSSMAFLHLEISFSGIQSWRTRAFRPRPPPEWCSWGSSASFRGAPGPFPLISFHTPKGTRYPPPPFLSQNWTLLLITQTPSWVEFFSLPFPFPFPMREPAWATTQRR